MLHTRRLNIVLLGLLVAAWMTGCRPAKFVPQGKYLLHQQKIHLANGKIDRESVKSYMKQKPNRQLLGLFRFHLGIYNMANGWNKDRKFKTWLTGTVGEPPVILDTNLTNRTLQQLELYINSTGYFGSRIDKRITYRKNKARIDYLINLSEPYRVNDIQYQIPGEMVRRYVKIDTVNTLVRRGAIYNQETLQQERDRMTDYLKNSGFFYFNREYIYVKADSTIGGRKINLVFKIVNPAGQEEEPAGEQVALDHQRYKINNVYYYPGYSSAPVNMQTFDTLKVDIRKHKKDSVSYSYKILIGEPLYINPKTLTQATFIRSGKFYKLKDVNETYKGLADLQNFKFTNIRFTDISDTPEIQNRTLGNYQLDCHIHLSKAPRQSFAIETEGTNSSGNLGLAGNVVYQNKNLFKGAEIFNIKVKGAIEAQNIVDQTSDDEVISSLPFNTVETGLQLSMNMPKFLMPIRQERFSKYFKPTSSAVAGINYQKRPDYTRYLTNVSFGYHWKESLYKQHILTPIEISSIKISKDPAFEEKLNAINDIKIKNSYSDHLITGSNYSFIFNNQKVNKLTDFVYLRINAEVAGNLLRFLNHTFRSDLNEENNSYELFKIRYAQYFRFNIDIRKYTIFDEKNTVVFRFRGGAGVPFTNLNVLPFEKSFFAGGANSIRSWKLRSLGPGSYNNRTNSRFDKIGDMVLEGSIEYRFPMYKSLKGALFVDAGNIWLMDENEQYSGGTFKFSEFPGEIAIGSGMGFRFDFTFFIIRLDIAFPVKDPSREKHDRWVLGSAGLNDLNYNLGIGYPF